MTTMTNTQHRSGGGPEELRRIVNVTRLHLTNRFSLLALPWMILGFIFLINAIIWWIIGTAAGAEAMESAGEGMQFSGASAFIFVYMLVVAVQAVNSTFPFALGYGATRRDFYLGSCLLFILLSAFYALGMTVLSVIERATGGWGLGGAMFDVIYFSTENAATQLVLFFLIFLFFFFVGAATSAVYVRWRTNGMLVFFAALTLALITSVAVITLTEHWPSVGAWFVANGALGVATWMLVPTALSALAGFVLIRRATPRN